MKRVVWSMIAVFCLAGCAGENTVLKEAAAFSKQYEGFAYHREQLSEEDKALYDIFYYEMSQHTIHFEIETDDEDAIFPIYEDVMKDHPELFWCDTNSLSYRKKTTLQQERYDIYVRNQLHPEQIEKNESLMKETVAPIIQKMNALPTVYEKVKAAYDYIIDQTSYDENSEYNQDIRSVFLNQKSVCAGYAKALQYLLQAVDVNCTYLSGTMRASQENHAWNMVEMDGAYYYLDVTNGDCSEEDMDQRWRYGYFAMTSEQMLRLYEPDGKYEESNAIQDNYFVREHMYLQSNDQSQIKEALSNGIQEHHGNLILQCATDEVCDDVTDDLQSDDTLFHLLKELGYPSTSFDLYQLKETNVLLYEAKQTK